jgi:hypothetical protein
MLSNDFCELDIFFHSVIIFYCRRTYRSGTSFPFMFVFYVQFHVNSSHAFAGGPDRQTWIDLCQKASLDPYGRAYQQVL